MAFRGVAIVLLGIAFILADNFDTTEGFTRRRRDGGRSEADQEVTVSESSDSLEA